MAWCSGIFLISPPVLFLLPSMTFSADVIFGLVGQEVGEVGYDDTKQASVGHVELQKDRILKLGGYLNLVS